MRTHISDPDHAARTGLVPSRGPDRKIRTRSKIEKPDQNKPMHLRGFGPMTRITASFGEVPAQALRERDMVRTRSGEFMKIEWIDRIILDERYLKYHPQAQPVLIQAGSLGRNLPTRDVMLAPLQPFSEQQRFFGKSPGFAADALGRPGVLRKPEPMITYTVFHCGRPTSVLTEGIWVDLAP